MSVSGCKFKLAFSTKQILITAKMGLTLTDAQIAQYHEAGYLLVPASEHGLVKANDLQLWAGQVQSWPKEKDKGCHMMR
jgi:hypothetical protein